MPSLSSASASPNAVMMDNGTFTPHLATDQSTPATTASDQSTPASTELNVSVPATTVSDVPAPAPATTSAASATKRPAPKCPAPKRAAPKSNTKNAKRKRNADDDDGDDDEEVSRPRKKSVRWTDEEVDTLKDAHDRQVPYDAIVDNFLPGRTGLACRLKYHTLSKKKKLEEAKIAEQFRQMSAQGLVHYPGQYGQSFTASMPPFAGHFTFAMPNGIAQFPPPPLPAPRGPKKILPKPEPHAQPPTPPVQPGEMPMVDIQPSSFTINGVYPPTYFHGLEQRLRNVRNHAAADDARRQRLIEEARAYQQFQQYQQYQQNLRPYAQQPPHIQLAYAQACDQYQPPAVQQPGATEPQKPHIHAPTPRRSAEQVLQYDPELYRETVAHSSDDNGLGLLMKAVDLTEAQGVDEQPISPHSQVPPCYPDMAVATAGTKCTAIQGPAVHAPQLQPPTSGRRTELPLQQMTSTPAAKPTDDATSNPRVDSIAHRASINNILN